mmetsp:Transcript_23801/g.42837  ORF Transcript_23801/g.42837 Transcript_23801/m.42837 type:complete len:153 (-) Transcript_23801:133-591(-)
MLCRQRLYIPWRSVCLVLLRPLSPPPLSLLMVLNRLSGLINDCANFFFLKKKKKKTPPAVNGSKTSCPNPSIIRPENKPNAVPRKAAAAVRNCAPIAVFLVNPALTNVAKSPSSCGISCSKTDIEANPPLDFNSENVVHDGNDEFAVAEWGI